MNTRYQKLAPETIRKERKGGKLFSSITSKKHAQYEEHILQLNEYKVSEADTLGLTYLHVEELKFKVSASDTLYSQRTKR